MPVTEYPHSLGCSVIGGVVYRGERDPGAARRLPVLRQLLAGRCGRSTRGSTRAQAPITLLETDRSISGFGIDDAGEVYLTDLGGALVKLVPAAS